MNSRRTRTVIAWMLAVLAVAPGVFARGQQSTKPSAPAATAEKRYAFVTVQGSGQEMIKRHIEPGDMPFMMSFGPGQAGVFYSGELEYRFGDKAVKGAPFAAQMSTEITQTLANGVHISHKMSGSLYRDSEGRMRREQTREEGPEIVTITDPVAGAIYTLRPSDRTATKLTFKATDAGPDMVFIHAETGTGANGDRTITATTERRAKIAGAGAVAMADPNGAMSRIKLQPKTESLGTQLVEGVNAEGTRSTITIPAGTQGNDQAFDIVSEKWYSPDLQMVVMSSHSDPRVGESVYRVTNISRAEPAHSLFEVPADFTTLTDDKAGFVVHTNKPKEN
jgi:hypothetical protein